MHWRYYLAVLLFAPLLCWGQALPDSGDSTAPRVPHGLLGFGIRLGTGTANFTQLDFVPTLDTFKTQNYALNNQQLSSYGIYFSYIPHNRFGLQWELLYTERGRMLLATHATEVLTLKYLETPILAQYSYPFGRFVRIKFLIGPTLGVALKASSRMVTDSTTSIVQAHYNPGNSFRGRVRLFDYGVNFGGGVDILVGPLLISLDGRYYYGTAEVAKPLQPNQPVNTSALYLLAGVGFVLHNKAIKH